MVMKTSNALALHRDDVRRLVERGRARNPRVFGSALLGKHTDASDIDILVDEIGRFTRVIPAQIRTWGFDSFTAPATKKCWIRPPAISQTATAVTQVKACRPEPTVPPAKDDGKDLNTSDAAP